MKKLSKILSVGLSLAMCASMVAPAFAASYADLNKAISSTTDGTFGENQDIYAATVDGVRNVTLNGDVNRGEKEAYISIAAGKNVTIDLNGYNIVDETTQTNATQAAYNIVVNGGTLTVEGEGTIKSDNTNVIMNYNDKSTLNLNGGTVEATGDKGIAVNTKGTATISEGVTVTGGKAGVQITGGTTTISEGATVSGGQAGALMSGGTLETAGNISSGEKYGIYGSGSSVSIAVSGGSVEGGTSGIYMQKGATATVDGADTTVKGGSTGVLMFDEGTTLTVNNGTIEGSSFGISGNGTPGWGGTTTEVLGGKVTGGHTGIYHPQNGTLNISGGTITGEKGAGVEIRGGTLNVSGDAEIISKANPGSSVANDNGVTNKGAGIAVVQHVTDQSINVNVSGGTITGATSIYQDNVQDRDDEAVAKVAINVTGGKLISTADESVNSENKGGFVTGGMSTDEIAEAYLGKVDISKYETSSIQKGMGQVGCYKVNGGELPYQVGYLTATTENDTVSLSVDGTANLPLAFYLNNAVVNGTVLTAVKWSVAEDDADIVSVENGTVTALAAGEATITATLHNGETVTFTVTVTPAPVIPDPVVIPADDPEIEIEDEDVPLAGLFTRADAIGYLWEQSGSPEWELSDFADVPEDHEWAVAIGWAQDMGIAVADKDGNFRPDDLVLRSVESLEISPEGELQEFLNRYAVYAGIELDAGELFIELEGSWDDIIMGEEAQVIFDDFFAKLEEALADLVA